MKQEIKSAEAFFTTPDPFVSELGKSVHVWKFPVFKAEFPLLTSSEREFSTRFRFEGDRRRYAAGRHALRLLLSKYLSLPPEDMVIDSDRNQKPILINPSSDIHFNIAHSGGWVLVSFANSALGIDIEKMDPAFSYIQLLEDHFSEQEKIFISEAPDPVVAFYFLWTRKEALTKAWGTGLRENLKEVGVLDLYSVNEKNHDLWRLESFKISTCYMAAVCCSGAGENVIYFDGNKLL